MKKVYTASILLLAMAIALAGCKNRPTSSDADAKPAQGNSSNSNSVSQLATNDNRPAGESSAKATTSGPNNRPRLIGTYAMTEVHAGGVVTMISQLKTEITFMADGTYTRISKKNNNIYHSDAGEFHVEGDDQLVLVIKLGKGKHLVPPLERKHAFTLSGDGEELKMTSDDGKTAVFRKVKNA